MKKRMISFCLVCCLLGALSGGAGAVSAEEAELVLPTALTKIEEEAFCGNTAARIYLQDRVTEIGERAFASCRDLHVIRIPASVVIIADNAFDGCSEELTICGKSRSTAQRFADAKGNQVSGGGQRGL